MQWSSCDIVAVLSVSIYSSLLLFVFCVVTLMVLCEEESTPTSEAELAPFHSELPVTPSSVILDNRTELRGSRHILITIDPVETGDRNSENGHTPYDIYYSSGDGGTLADQLDFCSICLSGSEEADGCWMILHDCKHKFHHDCMTKWLAVKRCCPMCRNYVP